MERTYENVDHTCGEVVGLLAYDALAAMTRLAKDGDQAPSIGAHIEHARMAARAFDAFKQLELWAEHRDLDLEGAAGEYSGLFDELEARTRPATWWERSTKTYVTFGILGDMMQQIAELHDLAFDVEYWDFGQGEWERANLAPLTAKDPQLEARLSLWARRVAGEVFGLVRSTFFTHPDLTSDPDAVDAIVAWVTKRHKERMEAINLKA